MEVNKQIIEEIQVIRNQILRYKKLRKKMYLLLNDIQFNFEH